MSSRSIKFLEPWGRRSWLVEYDGPYKNNRPPHVEVIGYTPTSGQVCALSDLRVVSPRALAWTVEGARNKHDPAHFTVYFGDAPESVLQDYV